MSTLARFAQACVLLHMSVCQIKNKTSETAVNPHSETPQSRLKSHWPLITLPECWEKQGIQKEQQNMSDFIPSWSVLVQFWLCFVWVLLSKPTRNMKTTISDIFLRRISFLSPLRMDRRWIITQHRSGPSRYTIWSWVYVCAGSLETAPDTAPCVVTQANRKGPTQETRNCACTGTSCRPRPVRRCAGNVVLRCGFLPPAKRSCRNSEEDLRTDICTMRIPMWDVLCVIRF